jgi:hypothetical protein
MNIDLPPKDWRSSDNREKPHEPMFGPGLPWGIGIGIGIIGAAFAIKYGYGALGAGAAAIVGAIVGNAIAAVRS